MICLGYIDEEMVVFGTGSDTMDDIVSRILVRVSKMQDLEFDAVMPEDAFEEEWEDIGHELYFAFKRISYGSEVLYDEESDTFFLFDSREEEHIEVSKSWLENYEFKIDWVVDSSDYL